VLNLPTEGHVVQGSPECAKAAWAAGHAAEYTCWDWSILGERQYSSHPGEAGSVSVEE